ncbi:MAG: LAGLIDADG family homing endonuclease, partial [Candidatus Woesearchaeota archaeon]
MGESDKQISSKMKSTEEIKVPNRIIDQVVGQEEAVEIINKAAKQRRHVLLIGEPGTGKCVGKDTLLLTEEGPKQAEKLFEEISSEKSFKNQEGNIYRSAKKSIFVFSLDDQGKICKRKITKTYQGKKKTCLKIKTQSGNEIILSGEHPLLTTDKGKIYFTSANKLHPNSWIGTVRTLPDFKKQTIAPRIKKNQVQYTGKNGRISLRLNLPKTMTTGLAYFLGMYMAEGYYDGNIRIDNYNQDIKDKIKQIIKKEFGYPDECFEEKENGLIIKRARTLAHILETYFDVSLVRKKQAHKKNVPRIITCSDRSIKAAFISGYIDGDGYISTRTGFQAISASKDLIDGLRIILLQLDIQSRSKESFKFASNTKNKTKRKYFELNIRDSKNMLRLNHLLNLKVIHKKENLASFLNKKHNTNVDVIPNLFSLLSSLKENLGMTFQELGTYHATFQKLKKN